MPLSTFVSVPLSALVAVKAAVGVVSFPGVNALIVTLCASEANTVPDALTRTR